MVALVKYRALPGKAAEAVSGLTSLIEKVLEEPHFISIRMHVDTTDPDSILLYEEWADGDYYNGAHGNTAHLKEFMNSSRAFLTGPPEITKWKTLKIFSA